MVVNVAMIDTISNGITGINTFTTTLSVALLKYVIVDKLNVTYGMRLTMASCTGSDIADVIISSMDSFSAVLTGYSVA